MDSYVDLAERGIKVAIINMVEIKCVQSIKKYVLISRQGISTEKSTL